MTHWTEDQYAAHLRAKGLAKQAHGTVDIMEQAVRNNSAPKESKLERRFSQQLTDNPDIAPHQRNYFFLPDRDLELDFAWAPIKVAVEVQGMAHRVKAMFKRDIEKRALALIAGWMVLEVGGDEIRSGQAITWLRQVMSLR